MRLVRPPTFASPSVGGRSDGGFVVPSPARPAQHLLAPQGAMAPHQRPKIFLYRFPKTGRGIFCTHLNDCSYGRECAQLLPRRLRCGLSFRRATSSSVAGYTILSPITLVNGRG